MDEDELITQQLLLGSAVKSPGVVCCDASDICHFSFSRHKINILLFTGVVTSCLGSLTLSSYQRTCCNFVKQLLMCSCLDLCPQREALLLLILAHN